MRTAIIFSALFLISIAANSQTQYDWSELTYHFQTGSVPPPYYYSYDVYISSTGLQGSLYYHGGYTSDSTRKDSSYSFEISVSAMTELNNYIKESEVLTKEIEALPEDKRPIGGSLNNLSITLTQDPRLDRKPIRKETPYFPKSKRQKKTLEKLYNVIKSIVPVTVWNDMDNKKSK